MDYLFFGYTAKNFSNFKQHTLAISLALLSPLGWADPAAKALPQIGNIASGTASIHRNSIQSQLTVTQKTDKLIANWNSFDVGANASVRFNQPNASSIALNRINSAAPSQIFGQVSANGKLVLVNPAGLVIGLSGQVSASAVIASTQQITDSDFNSDNLLFNRGDSSGEIVNRGRIIATEGDVVLLAPRIRNILDGFIQDGHGAVLAGNGNIFLANGEQLHVGNQRVDLYQPSTIPTLIEHSGQLQAKTIGNTAGKVELLGDRFQKGSLIDLDSAILNGRSVNIKGRDIKIYTLSTNSTISLDSTSKIIVDNYFGIPANQGLIIRYIPKEGNGLFFRNYGEIFLGEHSFFQMNGENYNFIYNIQQLQNIRNNLSGKYVLAGDINARSTESWNTGLGFIPLGGSTTTGANAPDNYFSGVLEGLGHTISNLTINRPQQNYVGLFGASQNASISNLTLFKPAINGQRHVGTLIGYNDVNAASRISSITLETGNILGEQNVGGLIGYNHLSTSGNALIDNIRTHGSVFGPIYILGKASVAGLIGKNETAAGSTFRLVNSYSGGYIETSGSYGQGLTGVAGMIGSNSNAGNMTIADSGGGGRIASINQAVGGLIGDNTTAGTLKISNSRAGGSVIANDFDSTQLTATDSLYFGGLIGRNTVGGTVTISNSSSSVNVFSKNSYAGGLIGLNIMNGTLNIDHSKSTGNVYGQDYTSTFIGANQFNSFNSNAKLDIRHSYAQGIGRGAYFVGGLIGANINAGSPIGNNNITIFSSYSDSVLSGRENMGGIIGAHQIDSGSLLLSNVFSSSAIFAGGSTTSGLIGHVTSGQNHSTRIVNSYTNGRGGILTGNALVGQVDGEGTVNVARSYWDTSITGKTVNATGGSGLTTAQMKQLSSYPDWSISNDPNGDSIWYLNEGISHPTLR